MFVYYKFSSQKSRERKPHKKSPEKLRTKENLLTFISFIFQGPSASAYVTYYKSEDALRAIQAVNNVLADGRTLKASLGTTKYCSHFMKNMPCPKHDCMYLHELGKLINAIITLTSIKVDCNGQCNI